MIRPWLTRMLAILLMLALVPRLVVGMPCPCACLKAEAGHSEAKRCACPCCDSKPIPSKGSPKPASGGGVHWCCATGFIPLTIPTATTTAFDQLSEDALVETDATPHDGYLPRIEDPPR